MSDIGLPDFGDRDLGIDLEKGIFLRGKTGKKGDNDSNDSGNNSMNTNGSGMHLKPIGIMIILIFVRVSNTFFEACL